jgi:putative transposase
VLDLFNREVAGWSISRRLTSELAVDALRKAVMRERPPRGLIFHSDRGVQYCSRPLRRFLRRHGMVQSMSRKGDCWDNAVAESFFGTLKRELVYHETYGTPAEARLSVFQYIEGWYNRKRRHSALGYMTPAEFEHAAMAA